jgi:RNA polymerase sigma-70 factor (ECF subfamily)
MHKHEDAEIAAKILDGNIELYAVLMDKYQDKVFALVSRRIPEKDVAAVVNESFVQAYKSLKSYSGNVPFGNWLTRIAIRATYSYWRQEYRQKKRHVSMPSGEEQRQWLEQLPDISSSDVDYNLKKQDALMLSKWVLGQLSPENRILIESIYFDEMPLKEVAEAQGWSLVKTKVRAMRARQKMRKLLEKIGESI